MSNHLPDLEATLINNMQGENAQQKNAEEYRTLFELSRDAIYVTNCSGKIARVNQAFADLIGYSKEEIKSKNIKELYVEPKVKVVFQQQLRKHGSVTDFKAKLRTKEGREIAVLFTSTLLGTVGNKVQGYLGIIRDITVELERERAEEALLESEDRYKYLLESVTDYIYTVIVRNGQEIETMHRPGCIAITGYEPHEYKADPNLWYRMVHEEDRDAVTNHIANLLSKQEVLPFEHRIIHKNGSVRWVKNTPVPRFDEQGNLVAYDGLVSEITERKQAEEALRESEEKYRLVVQNNNEAILVIQDGLIKFFNPKTSDISGYEEKELDSTPFLKICHPDDHDIVLKYICKNRSEELLSRIESFRIIEKSGKIKWIEISSVFINWAGLPAYLCFLSDITERKYLQDELARAQRLETAGRIAGQIAHDFNNLLSPLTAYPTLIREEIDEEHPIIEMVDEMEDSAIKIAEINQQLLALGRRGHYTMEPVDLNDLIHKVIMSENLQKEIVIKENLTSELFLIKAGNAQLTRAFVNLISNAQEAMHGKGILKICTENTYLEKPLRGYQTVSKGEYVKLQISDTGVGIKSEILDKIFDPFFTTKKMDRKRGSGLGLSVVHGIIEDHHGYILVDSKIKKGTTFAIFFPVSRKIEKEFTNVTKKLQGGDEKIMIVDDDPIQRRVANQLLKRLGYKVRAMSSGERAVNHLRKHRYDLVLLDMVMDGIDGVETYRQILERDPEQKAIILSGYAMSNKVEEALKLGAGSFVTKPITQKILAKVVRKELDRKKRRKQRLALRNKNLARPGRYSAIK